MPDHTDARASTTNDSPTSTEWPVLTDPIPAAEVTVDIAPEAADELARLYRDATARGYTDSFEVFLCNHIDAEWSVTVAGEPVADAVDAEVVSDSAD